MTKNTDKDKELTCKDIEIILGIENNILHECSDNSQLVIEAYPKGENYYGEILRRFNNQRIKPQRMISAEAKEAMYDKPACAWSEEDETMYAAVLQLITDSEKENGWNCVYCNHKNIYFSDIIAWLKSLKDRYTWKPSDEQIEILDMVLTNESMDDNIARILRELREQLKKLREE